MPRVLQCLNKLAGNSKRPKIFFQCWKCEQFIRVWTLFPSKCLLPFVTWQQSSFQGRSVTQRPGLHFSSWQDSPVKRELRALGCCGRRHRAHPSSKLQWCQWGQWWQQMRIIKHWDKSPTGCGKSLCSGVFKIHLTKSKQRSLNSAQALLWTGAHTRLLPVVPSNLNDWLCSECGIYWSKGKQIRSCPTL